MPPRGPRRGRRGPVPEIDLSVRSRSSFYEDQVLRRATPSAPPPSAAAAPAAVEAHRSMNPVTDMAIELAREGDDILLMPYQPTPSINPPKPRTRAIGYDSDTQTMWIRFRESRTDPAGAVYEYYNVPPRIWKNIRRVKSPGQFINRNMLGYEYRRTDI